jgi:hypothetical protein
MLIKDNVSRDVYATGIGFETFESLVMITVTKENTLLRSEFKFM